MRRCLNRLNQVSQARPSVSCSRGLASGGVDSLRQNSTSSQARFLHSATKGVAQASVVGGSGDLSGGDAASMQAWSRSGEQDLDDQYELLEKRRQAFTTAMQTVRAMTPSFTGARYHVRSDRRPAEVQMLFEDEPPSSDPTVVEGQDFVYPEQEPQMAFLRALFRTTQESPLDSVVASQRIIAMFDDPRNRCRLSIQAYTIAVSFALRIYDFRLLRRFMTHAQENSIIADTSLCNTVLGIFVHDNDLFSWSVALQMFGNAGIKANTDTWNQLLTLSDRQQKQFVLREMYAVGLKGDVVTQGIMLPLQRTYFSSTEEFVLSLKHVEWTPTLGDVLIGELLSTKDSTVARKLLEDDRFQLSIEGIEQILSHVLRISAQSFNHHKVTRQLCQQMSARSLTPRRRTFLILYRLGRRIRNSAYSDMIYSTAYDRNLIHPKLRTERSNQKRRGLFDSRQALRRTSLTWETWLRNSD